MEFLERLDEGHKSYFSDLLWNSTYDDDTKDELESQIWNAEIYGDIDLLMRDVFLNQIDPVSAGRNYNQSEWVRNRRHHG